MSDADADAADGAPLAPARSLRPARKSPVKSARRRAREFALQGLYEWLIGGADAGAVDAHVRELEGFAKSDRAHFDLLLHGTIAGAQEIDAALARHIDRKTELLSPIEHAALLIGGFELLRCIEIPYKVAINEAVELAKSFGGTDGHKYVNGVLDKAALELRAVEVEAARTSRGGAAAGRG